MSRLVALCDTVGNRVPSMTSVFRYYALLRDWRKEDVGAAGWCNMSVLVAAYHLDLR
jgi:hypothetical protein